MDGTGAAVVKAPQRNLLRAEREQEPDHMSHGVKVSPDRRTIFLPNMAPLDNPQTQLRTLPIRFQTHNKIKEISPDKRHRHVPTSSQKCNLK